MDLSMRKCISLGTDRGLPTSRLVSPRSHSQLATGLFSAGIFYKFSSSCSLPLPGAPPPSVRSSLPNPEMRCFSRFESRDNRITIRKHAKKATSKMKSATATVKKRSKTRNTSQRVPMFPTVHANCARKRLLMCVVIPHCAQSRLTRRLMKIIVQGFPTVLDK